MPGSIPEYIDIDRLRGRTRIVLKPWKRSKTGRFSFLANKKPTKIELRPFPRKIHNGVFWFKWMSENDIKGILLR